MASWSFVLTDLSGNTLGEVVNADERRLVFAHNRVGTVGMKLPLWHPLANTLLSTETLLKCYRTDLSGVKQIRFNGPVVSVEEAGTKDGQSIVVNAADPLWRLQYRLVGKSKTGYSAGTASVPVDRGSVLRDLVLLSNGDQFTGITPPASIVTGTTVAAGPWRYKPVLEAIAEIQASAAGFDFRITPTEPTNVGAGWPQLCTLAASSVLTTVRTEAIFEYGTTKANVSEYNRSVDRSTRITQGYILASGWPTGAGVNELYSPALLTGHPDYTDPYISTAGLYEGVVEDGGVTWDILRQALVNEHVSARRNPKQIVTFKPAINARPAPFDDYIAGDQVRCRAEVNGLQRFDGMFRVWGISIDVDKNGNESVELELTVP